MMIESIKQFSKLLFSLTKTIGGKIWATAQEKLNESDNLFHEISNNYLTRFYQRYGYIQVLGMATPMEISSIFIEIQTSDRLSKNDHMSLEKLTTQFVQNALNMRSLIIGDSSLKTDALKIAGEEKRLMVVGAPGGGKSTLLKKIGIHCLTGIGNTQLKGYLPILIELKKIDSNNNIRKLIQNELEVAGFPYPELFLEESLKTGKLLLLFDGLDELPQELETKTLADIQDFCDRHLGNRFIISCRTAAYDGGIKNFKNVEIANLDLNQIKGFIKKWFSEKQKQNPNSVDISEQCWDRIISPQFFATLELAQSPLLLTLLCLVYHSEQDFPRNRALLYREAITVLLKEWNSEKRIYGNAIYKDMTLPFEELLLSHIAHHYFVKGEYFFDKNELGQFISKFISENLNAPRYLDGRAILETISIQQGILVERAKNIYSFSHLTFQEYFTAKYIDDYNVVDEYASQNIDNPKWREIFIMLCGIMKIGADKLLASIFQSICRDKEQNQPLSMFLSQVNQVIISKQLIFKLTDLYLLLLFGTEYISALYKVQINLLALIREVDYQIYEQVTSSWIQDMKLNNSFHFSLYNNLLSALNDDSIVVNGIRNCLKEFNANADNNNIKAKFLFLTGIKRIEINDDLTKCISEYLDKLMFLVHCKNSAILVTKQNWEQIEKQIFSS